VSNPLLRALNRAAPSREAAKRHSKPMTVLSHGLGRDSSAMTCLLIEGKLKVDGEEIGPESMTAMVFSDPGYEWSFTNGAMGVGPVPELVALDAMRDLLAPHEIPLHVLKTPPKRLWYDWWRRRREAWLASFGQIQRLRSQGNARKASRLWSKLSKAVPRGALPWQPESLMDASIEQKAEAGYYQSDIPLLERVMERSRPIILRRAGGVRSAECTSHHKIQPIRHYLSDLVRREYPSIERAMNDTERNKGTVYLADRDHRGHRIRRNDPQAALKLFGAKVDAGLLPPIRLLIGLAADETTRIERGAEGREKAPEYVRIAIQELYPLAEAGIAKDDEIAILSRHGLNWIRKSGCVFCPEGGKPNMWALSRWHPPTYRRVVELEKAAVRRNPRFTWFGGKKMLPEVMRGWRKNNPRETVEGVLDKGYDHSVGSF